MFALHVKSSDGNSVNKIADFHDARAMLKQGLAKYAMAIILSPTASCIHEGKQLDVPIYAEAETKHNMTAIIYSR